uniref:Uncharacterized protein n=1 Tax=Anguilla anguilla TaxID=7936 RepID=A0A0E9WZD6_ANGAN
MGSLCLQYWKSLCWLLTKLQTMIIYKSSVLHPSSKLKRKQGERKAGEDIKPLLFQNKNSLTLLSFEDME